eukprot:g5769.t1
MSIRGKIIARLLLDVRGAEAGMAPRPASCSTTGTPANGVSSFSYLETSRRCLLFEPLADLPLPDWSTDGIPIENADECAPRIHVHDWARAIIEGLSTEGLEPCCLDWSELFEEMEPQAQHDDQDCDHWRHDVDDFDIDKGRG